MSWQLRRLPVCASTEIELDRWLERRQAAGMSLQRLAVTARRQRFGHGQQGRPWLSPAGGIWLSAAIPWAGSLPGTASLGLAVAVGLAQQLEALGLAVQLKWPNDLLVGDRKIAGLLPRLRLRGQRIRAAQVGVGLNGCNPVPPGALSVAQALGWLMTTRGLSELVVLTVGVSLGVITPELFTMGVLMALITTAMAGPLLARLGYGRVASAPPLLL